MCRSHGPLQARPLPLLVANLREFAWELLRNGRSVNLGVCRPAPADGSLATRIDVDPGTVGVLPSSHHVLRAMRCPMCGQADRSADLLPVPTRRGQAAPHGRSGDLWVPGVRWKTSIAALGRYDHQSWPGSCSPPRTAAGATCGPRSGVSSPMQPPLHTVHSSARRWSPSCRRVDRAVGNGAMTRAEIWLSPSAGRSVGPLAGCCAAAVRGASGGEPERNASRAPS